MKLNKFVSFHQLGAEHSPDAKLTKPKHTHTHTSIFSYKSRSKTQHLNSGHQVSPRVCQNITQVKGLRVVAGVSLRLLAGVECGACDGGHPVAM